MVRVVWSGAAAIPARRAATCDTPHQRHPPVIGMSTPAFDGEMAGDIPLVDVSVFLNRGESAETEERAKVECKRVADAFAKFGIVVVRDPRASEEDNARFLDTVERYFEQPEEEIMKDVRPDLSFQVRRGAVWRPQRLARRAEHETALPTWTGPHRGIRRARP